MDRKCCKKDYLKFLSAFELCLTISDFTCSKCPSGIWTAGPLNQRSQQSSHRPRDFVTTERCRKQRYVGHVARLKGKLLLSESRWENLLWSDYFKDEEVDGSTILRRILARRGGKWMELAQNTCWAMASGVSSTEPSLSAAGVKEVLNVSTVTVCGLEKQWFDFSLHQAETISEAHRASN
jgi:hypothetical protein